MNLRKFKPYASRYANPVRQYGLHDLEASSDRFGPLAGFVDVWKSKWQGGMPPPWSAFDFFDFVGWHGWIHVDEMVSEEPFEMRCRLWGTELVHWLGMDETGQLLSASPAVNERNLIPFYREILALPAIGTNAGKVLSYGQTSLWTVVKLPCPGAGAEPDVILSCSVQGVALHFDSGALLTGAAPS